MQIGYEKSQFQPASHFISETIKEKPVNTEYQQEIIKWSIEWCRFQWPWMTRIQDVKGTSLFDVKYLVNSTRYRHSYNGLLIKIYI